MPSNVVKSFSDKTGMPIKDVEKLWDKSIKIVKDQYKEVPEDSDKFYSLVTGVLKNMLKLEEPSITTQSIGGADAQYAKKIGSDCKKKKLDKIKEYLKNI